MSEQTLSPHRSYTSIGLLYIRTSFLIILSTLYLLYNSEAIGWRRGFVVIAILSYLITHLMYASKRKSYHWIGIGIDLIIGALFSYVFLGGTFPDLLFLGLAGLYLFLYTDHPKLRVGGSVFLVGFILVIYVVETIVLQYVSIIYFFINGSFVIFASSIGILIRDSINSRRKISKLYADLQISHTKLQEYANQVEKMSAQRERIRIAREIHDTVGHTMTALLVQLQATRKLQEIDPEKSKELLLACEELARSALSEVRVSVKTIRDDDYHQLELQPLLYKCIQEFSKVTGMHIEFEVEGEESYLNQQARFALLRVLQEALTNTQKHGEAQNVWVKLAMKEDGLKLTIADDGKGVERIVPGFGLINMQERIQELRGMVHFTSSESQGFKVEVILPYQS